MSLKKCVYLLSKKKKEGGLRKEQKYLSQNISKYDENNKAHRPKKPHAHQAE